MNYEDLLSRVSPSTAARGLATAEAARVRIETMKVVFILSVGLEGVVSWEFFVSCEAGR